MYYEKCPRDGVYAAGKGTHAYCCTRGTLVENGCVATEYCGYPYRYDDGGDDTGECLPFVYEGVLYPMCTPVKYDMTYGYPIFDNWGFCATAVYQDLSYVARKFCTEEMAAQSAALTATTTTTEDTNSGKKKYN